MKTFEKNSRKDDLIALAGSRKSTFFPESTERPLGQLDFKRVQNGRRRGLSDALQTSIFEPLNVPLRRNDEYY